MEAPSVGAEAELVKREKTFRDREIKQYRNQFIFTIIFGIPLLLGMLAPTSLPFLPSSWSPCSSLPSPER